MAVGWFDDLNDAKAYFTVERLITTAWDNLTDAQKTKVIINSYNRIYYDPDYAVPTYAAATPAQLIILKKANGEMGYYLAQHLDDEDRRKGIQVQGTLNADIVKENYERDMLDDLPVPPFVDALLDGLKTLKGAYKTDIDRDEDESVDENVTGF